jgi:hypothetical protein
MTEGTDPVMWADGNGLQLAVQSPHGPLYLQDLALVALRAQAYGGEILRFTYDRTDPEDGTVTRGAGRIVYQELPDPRQTPEGEACAICGGSPHLPQPEVPGAPYHRYVKKGEEQPAAPADATSAPAPTVFDEAAKDPRINPGREAFLGGVLQHFREATEATSDVNPADDPITPEEHAQGVRLVDRPSGPPFRVVDL